MRSLDWCIGALCLKGVEAHCTGFCSLSPRMPCPMEPSPGILRHELLELGLYFFVILVSLGEFASMIEEIEEGGVIGHRARLRGRRLGWLPLI